MSVWASVFDKKRIDSANWVTGHNRWVNILALGRRKLFDNAVCHVAWYHSRYIDKKTTLIEIYRYIM